MLLEQRHPCQQTPVEDDGAGPVVDDGEDHDDALWEAVTELLTTLPKVLGASWRPHFDRLLPALQPYLREAHPSSDHSLAIGIIAESLNQLEQNGSTYFEQVVPHALRFSASSDCTCRQNSVFCLGVLGLFGERCTVLRYMQSMLEALQPRLSDEEEEVVCDNGIGAIARLVLAYGCDLPLSSIVPAILARLPLKADKGENAPAIRCLMQVAHDERTRGMMECHGNALLSVLACMLGSDYAEGPVQLEIRAFLQWLHAQAPEQLTAMAMALAEPSQRTRLLECLTPR